MLFCLSHRDERVEKMNLLLIIHSGPVVRTVPIKKPRARLIYITIRVNQISIFTLEITFKRTENLS